MKVNELKRGTIVRALKDLDPEGADVKKGQLGVVFGDANCYGDEAGPIVRWLDVVGGKVEVAGVCNVYEGWVEEHAPIDVAGIHTPPSVEDSYAVARLLDYSWKDIDYIYEGLTEEERKLLTKEEFLDISAWVKRALKLDEKKAR